MHVLDVRRRRALARGDLPLLWLLEQRRDPGACATGRRSIPARWAGTCSTASGLLTAALTGFYIFRLICRWSSGGTYRGGAIAGLTEHAEAASEAHSATGDPLAQVHEPGPSMFIPMAILAVLVSLAASTVRRGMTGSASSSAPTVHSVPGLPTSDPRFWIADAVGLGVALLGIGFAWLRYGRGQISVSEKEAPAVAFVRSGLALDALYSAVIVRPLLALGRGLRRSSRGSRAGWRDTRRRRSLRRGQSRAADVADGLRAQLRRLDLPRRGADRPVLHDLPTTALARVNG